MDLIKGNIMKEIALEAEKDTIKMDMNSIDEGGIVIEKDSTGNYYIGVDLSPDGSK